LLGGLGVGVELERMTKWNVKMKEHFHVDSGYYFQKGDKK
jgi:hypothetical protein